MTSLATTFSKQNMTFVESVQNNVLSQMALPGVLNRIFKVWLQHRPIQFTFIICLSVSIYDKQALCHFWHICLYLDDNLICHCLHNHLLYITRM